jgi:hypothetical protein
MQKKIFVLFLIILALPAFSFFIPNSYYTSPFSALSLIRQACSIANASAAVTSYRTTTTSKSTRSYESSSDTSRSTRSNYTETHSRRSSGSIPRYSREETQSHRKLAPQEGERGNFGRAVARLFTGHRVVEKNGKDVVVNARDARRSDAPRGGLIGRLFGEDSGKESHSAKGRKNARSSLSSTAILQIEGVNDKGGRPVTFVSRSSPSNPYSISQSKKNVTLPGGEGQHKAHLTIIFSGSRRPPTEKTIIKHGGAINLETGKLAGSSNMVKIGRCTYAYTQNYPLSASTAVRWVNSDKVRAPANDI